MINQWGYGGDGDYKEMTMDSHALELSNYVIANSCEVVLFVECVGDNEVVVDDNFSKDDNDESLKNS